MRAEVKGRGLIVYEKEREDLLQEAVLAMARQNAQSLSDEEAAPLGVLFPQWEAGSTYLAGTRISDEAGSLYKVVQDHVAQADWPVESTPALYTKLGVTVENPDAVPDWVQPTGAHDAYQTGDTVRYEGTIYISAVDGNVWKPGVYGWNEVSE